MNRFRVRHHPRSPTASADNCLQSASHVLLANMYNLSINHGLKVFTLLSIPLRSRKSLACSSVSVIRWLSRCKVISKTDPKIIKAAIPQVSKNERSCSKMNNIYVSFDWSFEWVKKRISHKMSPDRWVGWETKQRFCTDKHVIQRFYPIHLTLSITTPRIWQLSVIC